jgi:hypothetical protein
VPELCREIGSIAHESKPTVGERRIEVDAKIFGERFEVRSAIASDHRRALAFPERDADEVETSGRFPAPEPAGEEMDARWCDSAQTLVQRSNTALNHVRSNSPIVVTDLWGGELRRAPGMARPLTG